MKIQNWKKQEVETLKKLILEYPVLGVVDSTNLPSMQLQKMRFKLKPDVLIRMTKSRLLKLALEQIKDKKPGIEKLENYIKYNIPILLFSKKDSFRLSKFLIKNKSAAPAKPGQKAPNDILIPAGPTEFTPGPVIGELGQAGLKTGVEGGKIVIKEDKLITREGDIINDKVAAVLAKLGIQPMRIGFNLLTTYDNGLVYEKKLLNIDEEQTIKDITLAAVQAFNLAFKIEYPTKENIKLLLKKAELESIAVESKLNLKEVKTEGKVEPTKEEKVEEVKEQPVVPKEVKEELVKEAEKPVEAKPEIKEPENNIERDSQVALDVLKRLQDEKLKKPMHIKPFVEKPAKKVKIDDVFKK